MGRGIFSVELKKCRGNQRLGWKAKYEKFKFSWNLGTLLHIWMKGRKCLLLLRTPKIKHFIKKGIYSVRNQYLQFSWLLVSFRISCLHLFHSFSTALSLTLDVSFYSLASSCCCVGTSESESLLFLYHCSKESTQTWELEVAWARII